MNEASEPLPPGPGIVYQVVRSPRRRSFGVAALPDGTFEVRIPQQATEEALQAALAQFIPWMERVRRSRPAPVKRKGIPGETFPLLGQFLTLVYRPGLPGARLIRQEGETLQTPLTDPAANLAALEAFYRRNARRILTAKVEQFCRAFDLQFKDVAITGAERRYGSCSADHTLHFAWQLVMYPERLIESVVCHELAHFSEMNHSVRFYRVLAQYRPDYRREQRELRAWNAKIPHW